MAVRQGIYEEGACVNPAFSSTKQAAAFVVLTAAVLMLPAIFGAGWLPPRDQVYSYAPTTLGVYYWLRQQIFEEKAPVDIVFIGSSRMFGGISPRYVQTALSEKLGHPATVITLGWPWAGFDTTYFITQDLLKHRQVRMAVIYDEDTRADDPHATSSIWFRWGENAGDLAGLPLWYKAGLYTSAVFGMPRNCLSLVRTNLDLDPRAENYWETAFYHAPDPATELGALSVRTRLVANPNPRLRRDNDPGFSIFQPSNQVARAAVCIYSAATSNRFAFTGPPTRPYQSFFVRALSALAQKQGTKLVILHLPTFPEAKNRLITERENWPATLPAPVALVGIPPADLFSGLNDEEVTRFFYNDSHFNQNGLEFFTRLITPALLQIYANPVDSR